RTPMQSAHLPYSTLFRSIPIDAVTGFPEMMEGRVKTLHPKVHGGLLARRGHPGDRAALEQHGITPIDLVAVNLYPFRETVARPEIGRAHVRTPGTWPCRI